MEPRPEWAGVAVVPGAATRGKLSIRTLEGQPKRLRLPFLFDQDSGITDD